MRLNNNNNKMKSNTVPVIYLIIIFIILVAISIILGIIDDKERIINKQHDVVTYTTVIDSCEYIVALRTSTEGVSIIHKQNCKNHKQKH